MDRARIAVHKDTDRQVGLRTQDKGTREAWANTPVLALHNGFAELGLGEKTNTVSAKRESTTVLERSELRLRMKQVPLEEILIDQ